MLLHRQQGLSTLSHQERDSAWSVLLRSVGKPVSLALHPTVLLSPAPVTGLKTGWADAPVEGTPGERLGVVCASPVLLGEPVSLALHPPVLLSPGPVTGLLTGRADVLSREPR